MELLKVGKEKRALKVLKNKLGALHPGSRRVHIDAHKRHHFSRHHARHPSVGCMKVLRLRVSPCSAGTHKRAKAKREEMATALRNQRMK